MFLAIYIVVAILVMMAIMFDDLTHDSPFKTRMQAIKYGVLLGALWPSTLAALLVLVIYTYIKK